VEVLVSQNLPVAVSSSASCCPLLHHRQESWLTGWQVLFYSIASLHGGFWDSFVKKSCCCFFKEIRKRRRREESDSSIRESGTTSARTLRADQSQNFHILF